MILLLVAALAGGCGGKEEPDSPKGAGASAEAPPPEIARLLDAAARGDEEDLLGAARALLLADPRAFFEDHFDAETARRLATDYDRETLARRLADAARRIVKAGRRAMVSLETHRKEDPGKATGLQRDALEAARSPLVLLTLVCRSGSDDPGFVLWSFVRVGEDLRYLGRMESL